MDGSGSRSYTHLHGRDGLWRRAAAVRGRESGWHRHAHQARAV